MNSGHQFGGVVAVINSSAGDEELFLGQFCGGVQLSLSTVVTAEHCVSGRLPSSVAVVSGVEDLCGPPPGDFDRAVVAEVKRISAGGGELVELQLASPLRPVPISAQIQRDIPVGEARAYGWGRSSVAGVPQCEIRAVPLRVAPASDCEILARPLDIAPQLVLCTVPTNGTNTCDGDSGGPVYWRRAAEEVVVAAVLSGLGCGAEDVGLNVIIVGSQRE